MLSRTFCLFCCIGKIPRWDRVSKQTSLVNTSLLSIRKSSQQSGPNKAAGEVTDFQPVAPCAHLCTYICLCHPGSLLKCPHRPKDSVQKVEPALLCLTCPHMKRFTVASVRVNLLQAWHKIHANLSLQHPTPVDTARGILPQSAPLEQTLREWQELSRFCVLCTWWTDCFTWGDDLMISIKRALSAPFRAAQKLAKYSVVQRYSWIFWIALRGNQHYKLSGAIHYHICCIERIFDDCFCFKCIRPLYCEEVFIMCLWRKPVLTGVVYVHRAKPVKRCSFPRSAPALRSVPCSTRNDKNTDYIIFCQFLHAPCALFWLIFP